jgi:hypothetical protein
MKPLATPSAKHMLKRGQRHNDAAKKRRATLFNLRFKSIRKKYATFSLLFHFSFLVFHCDFRQKKITQLKILKS